jgi:hypothetical protein
LPNASAEPASPSSTSPRRSDDITGHPRRPDAWTLDGCFITNALKGTVPVDFIVLALDEDANDVRVVRLRDDDPMGAPE